MGTALKTAIVIGATGLIGRQLTNQLLNDGRYNVVKIFVRRTLSINNQKLVEHIVDFSHIEMWKNKLTGDELFSAMGTTIKQAGSKETQYTVDYTYQHETAKAAAENGVKNYFLVSSTGANSKSKNFYLRIKGELEESVAQLPFRKVVIFQPSFLLGERNEKRRGEKIGAALAKILTMSIPWIKKYRPIEATVVAQAMIHSANHDTQNKLVKYSLDKIFEIAQ